MHKYLLLAITVVLTLLVLYNPRFAAVIPFLLYCTATSSKHGGGAAGPFHGGLELSSRQLRLRTSIALELLSVSTDRDYAAAVNRLGDLGPAEFKKECLGLIERAQKICGDEPICRVKINRAKSLLLNLDD